MPNASQLPPSAAPIPGTGQPAPRGACYVPVFPGGGSGVHINHGFFWPNLAAPILDPRFFWDFWVRVDSINQTGYVISDGYGGNHAILFGVDSVSGAVALSGNCYNGTTLTSFGGGYLFQAGEWAYIAAAWDGTYIRTYVNGVCDGRVSFPTSPGRYSVPTGSGGGVVYIGGSDHANFQGAIAFARGWDGLDVFGTGNTDIRIGWVPQHFPTNHAQLNRTPCNFWADYTNLGGGRQSDTSTHGRMDGANAAWFLTTVTTGATSTTQLVGSTAGMAIGDIIRFNTIGTTVQVSSITDATHVVVSASVTSTTGEIVQNLSFPRERYHPGRPMKTSQTAVTVSALTYLYGPVITRSELDGGPVWTLDNNCPLWRPAGATSDGRTARAPLAVPGTARAFDSFSRANSHFGFTNEANITLGSTEGGSLGPLVWQKTTSPAGPRVQSWGLLGYSVVPLNYQTGGSYISSNSADMDVQVTRRKTAYDHGATGLLFRVVDADNFWICDYDPTPNQVVLRTVTANGTPVNFGGGAWTPSGSTWLQLRVVTSGTNITVYTGDGLGNWTTLGTVSSATFQAGTGAGIGTGIGLANQDSLWRATNFTLF